MPHLCTACGRSFADGSSEMLTGCPDCGGSTFQYDPEGTDGPVANAGVDGDGATASEVGATDDDPASTPSATPTADSRGAEADARGHDARESEDREPAPGATASGRGEHASERENSSGPENSAQAQARAELADPPAYEATTDEPTPSPDPETVREALTDQFESIRVIDRGQYELNLMELFERDEYIVRLGEEGRYHIQMPESRR